MSVELVAIGLGTFVGLVLALTGAGGAILAIPLLVYFLHLNITQAAPVALFAIMLSAGVAAISGLKAGIVRYKAAGLMATLGMIFAPLGVWLSHHLPLPILEILFSITLAYVAFRMWRGSISDSLNNEAPACQINPVSSKLFWTAPCTARLSLTGSFAGLLSGLLGVGGGFVIVPALQKVSNFDMKTTIATSLAVISLVSFSGLISYALHYHLNWELTLVFGASTILGMLIGKLLSSKISSRMTQRLFAVLAFVIAISFAWRFIINFH